MSRGMGLSKKLVKEILYDITNLTWKKQVKSIDTFKRDSIVCSCEQPSKSISYIAGIYVKKKH